MTRVLIFALLAVTPAALLAQPASSAPPTASDPKQNNAPPKPESQAKANAQTSTKGKPAVAGELAGQGPLDFRCDDMQILTKPNRTVCRGNVVVRRSDIMVCCQSFEGIADDKWQWRKLICNQDVRAQRGEETMWAEKAEFVPDTSDLLLTGKPMVRRAQSLLWGDRVTVNMNEERARVEHATGSIVADELDNKKPDGKQKPTAGPATGTLPATCPLPSAPSRGSPHK